MWKQLSGRRSSPLSRSGQQRKVNCQGQPKANHTSVQGTTSSHQQPNFPPNSIKDHESNNREAAKKSSGSVSGDASAEEDAILEELAMISSQRSNAEAASMMASVVSAAETEEEEEERDAFEDMPSPLSLPASGSVHRPIPLLHSAAPRGSGHHQHPRLQALQASSCSGVPMSSGSSGQSSLPASPSTTSGSSLDQDSGSGSAAVNSNKQGMSRSISDSTLRRAALHLNLNQSVLPSFTSLQQFKVYKHT